MADECGDGFFGPAVFSPGCRGGFDFTVVFEESMLSIAPAACFLLMVPFRISQLWNSPIRVKKTAIYGAKLSVAAMLPVVQLAALAVVASSWAAGGRVTVAAAVLNFLAGLTLVPLLHLEHLKSVRPSFLISAYLLVSILFDASRVRTAYLQSISIANAALLTVSLSIKLALFVLETIEKRRLLELNEKGASIERTSGPVNRGFFIWLNSLLRRGFTTLLSTEALPSIHEKLAADNSHARFDEAWKKSSNQKHKYALLKATLNCLRTEILIIALPRISLVALRTAQPFLIAQALLFVQSTEDEIPTSRGYGLIGAFAFVYILAAVTRSWYEHLGFRAMTMLRGGMIALIYDKMMTLPLGNVSESGAMSIMGSDVETLAESFHLFICDSWANIVQLAIATWLLAGQLGAVCVAPIIVAVAFTSASFRLGKVVRSRQKRWLEYIEKRINFTSEVLGSVKSVKMLGLTEKMTSTIERMREEEIVVMKKSRSIGSVNTALINLPQFFGQFLTLGSYAIAAKVQGNAPLSINQAINALSLLNLLVMPLAELLMSIPMSFTSMGCMQRIQEFLLQESRVERRVIETADLRLSNWNPPSPNEVELADRPSKSRDLTISIRDCTFGWSSGLQSTLTTTLKPGLVMVVGPVGCGKSTFLRSLINETATLTGDLRLPVARIAFCAQSTWVTNGTIRDNILGESKPIDEEWYSTVVHACDLETDFKQLSEGDMTVVGSKGVKLSGGQKQRVSVARAVYSRARVAIFDDVFSGLDKVTEQAVFDRVFGQGGLLRRIGTTVILSTHSVRHLPAADDIIALGRDGTIIEQGSFADLSKADGYIQSLDVIAGTDRTAEDSFTGADLEELARKITTAAGEADDLSQVTDLAVWKYYGSSLGWWRLLLWLALLAAFSAIAAFRFIWVSWWASSENAGSGDSLGYWLGIYGALGVVESIGLVAACFYLFLGIIPSTSRGLHSAVLNAAMKAPMSFLSNTETGVLVNRFSQDMRLVDMVLPRALLIVGTQAIDIIAQAGVAIGAIPQIAATLPFLVGILWMIQRFYLRTSRQLRLLEIESKAPLFTHFIESLAGLVTIRAYGWSAPYMDRTLSLINAAQQPYYLLLCIQRWLVCVLDLVVAGMTIIIVGLAVGLRSKINPGLLGVALVLMMTLGFTLAALIQFWTMLETSLGAVARIKTFHDETPCELLPEENGEPGEEWPKAGLIEFSNVSLSYKVQAPAVVKDISVSIPAGQKFGLVGRTGSGKSSLVLSLLRLVDISDGTITLDGEDLTTLPRPLIRQRLSCLTQEPFIFTSTIRLNADPLEENSDVNISAALDRVGLWGTISAKANPDGSNTVNPLNATMDEDFLSHGQRQLFCLARALLKKSTVLILDEPTSSVDSQTDAQMQAVIQSEFKHCTIIMIAHRLDSLLDFDVVAVLDKGRIVEVGSPRELLTTSGSVFSAMYNTSSLNVIEA